MGSEMGIRDRFVNLIKDNARGNKKFEDFLKKYKHGDYYDKISVLISEWANGGDLGDYIKNNYKKLKTKEWRVLFFQIISVLAVIHKKYPNFRHNDLKANNILIQNINMGKKPDIYKYSIDQVDFYVPNIGIQAKIWDFDFATIPGVVDNSKVTAEWTTRINIKPVKNQYYDIHYFFNTFTTKGFFPQFWTEDCIEKEVKDFVRRIIPLHLVSKESVTERGRILSDNEYTTPYKILMEDEFFKRLRVQ